MYIAIDLVSQCPALTTARHQYRSSSSNNGSSPRAVSRTTTTAPAYVLVSCFGFLCQPHRVVPCVCVCTAVFTTPSTCDNSSNFSCPTSKSTTHLRTCPVIEITTLKWCSSLFNLRHLPDFESTTSRKGTMHPTTQTIPSPSLLGGNQPSSNSLRSSRPQSRLERGNSFTPATPIPTASSLARSVVQLSACFCCRSHVQLSRVSRLGFVSKEFPSPIPEFMRHLSCHKNQTFK